MTVDAAYAEVQRITRREAKNFAYGIIVLPREKRRAIAAIYAFARRVDDIADGDLPPAEKRARLEALRAGLDAPPAGAMLLAEYVKWPGNWFSPRGYTGAVFTSPQPTCNEGVATGDLTGTGCWQLRDLGETTRVQYTWTVTTGKGWMNLLAPLLAPVFAWNHDQVMHEGGRGVAQHLGVALLAFQGSGASDQLSAADSSGRPSRGR